MACVFSYRTPDPRCGHRGCYDGWRESLLTVPNLITLTRTLLALVLAATAVSSGSRRLLVAALLSYWVGDILDGIVARALHQETRAGALFDVLADRACCVAFWLPWAVWHPGVTVPVFLYLFEFVLVDGLLSSLWLAWPLTSCNYVERVDGPVWRLNWWPPAKSVNTAALVIFAVVWHLPVVATLLVAAVLAVKTWSLLRLHAMLPAPPPGCAAASDSITVAGIV